MYCPAYLAGTPGLEPSSLPVEPSEEDLAPTLDAPHSEELVAKAAELSNDPVYIYEWVRNNIDFEPYYGSKKGASETLSQMAGNDTDTASLLISLYRISGIPARYVTGVIEITAEQATSWTAVQTPEAAQRLFASGGVPIQGIIEGGRLSRFRLTHTYVEAYLPYTSYRGVEEGEGPRRWLPLDPSYKSYKLSRATRRANELDLGLEDWMSDYMESGQAGEDFVTAFDYDLLKAGLESGMTGAEQGFSDIKDQLKASEVVRPAIVTEQSSGLLPPRLPYAVVRPEGEFREVDPQCRHVVRIEIKHREGTVLSFSYPVPQMGKDPTLNVLFSGYTEEDRMLAANYDDVSDIPCYLVQVVPEVARGEELLVVGDQPVGMGEAVTMELAVGVGQAELSSSDAVTAGGIYSICFCGGEPSPQVLASWSQRMHAINSSLEAYMEDPRGDFPVDHRELATALTGSVGVAYWSQLLMLDDMLASSAGITHVNHACLGISAIDLGRGEVYGVPTSINAKGFYIDVDIDALSVEPCLAAAREMEYLLGRGIVSSSLEAQVMEALFGLEGISTTKVLQVANNSEIPIFLIGSENLESCLSRMNISEQTQNHVRQLVLSGYQIACPQRDVSYKGFQGTGYAAIDPLSGSCGFYISGGTAGGVSLPSLLGISNGSPEYIEYPELPKDGDNEVWEEVVDTTLLITGGVCTAICAASKKPIRSATVFCAAVASIIGPAYVLFSSLASAIGEYSVTHKIDLIILGYIISWIFNAAVVGMAAGAILTEIGAVAPYAAISIMASVAAAYVGYIFRS